MGRKKIKHNYNQVYQEHLNGKSLKNISKELKNSFIKHLWLFLEKII